MSRSLRPALRAFLADEQGASSFEFALILPVLFVFIFGTIDVGGYAIRLNMLEKATQVGARVAVVTDVIPTGLASQQYIGQVVGGTTLNQGDLIPAAALGKITCISGSCTCTTTPCPTPGYSSTAFNYVLTRMQAVDPNIQASNLKIEYRGSGLGYTGDPSGIQIAPLVTVRLINMTYTTIVGKIFKGGINLPDFAYTLTMEDGSGTRSN
jgi:Flp pilus assembly pilin Flp